MVSGDVAYIHVCGGSNPSLRIECSNYNWLLLFSLLRYFIYINLLIIYIKNMNEEMYCDDSNEVQLFYKIELRVPSDDAITDPEKQKPYIFDLLNTFQTSFMGKSFPLVDDQIPEDVKPASHFISFDKEHGLVLCVNFFVEYNKMHSTEAIKEILTKLDEELDGQFSDGWGENSFGFEHDGKVIYAEFSSSNLCKIVMPVMGYCSQFNVKWSSIEEIEKVEWMCGLENGAYNMLHNPKRHEENLKGYSFSKKMLEKFDYVKEHLNKFF